MGLFQSKWAAEILLETKRIFGLDHDASEQEVHEHLRSVESFEQFTAQARENVEKQFTAPTERENALQGEKDALENRVNELASQVDTLQTNLAALKEEAEALKQDAEAKAEEIERLKAEAADTHTGGDTNAVSNSLSTRPYLESPITKKAFAMRQRAK